MSLRVLVKIVLAFVVTTLFWGAGEASAVGWRVEGKIASPALTDRLAERYPDIRNATDLQNLLRDFGSRQHMLKLEATLEKGVWVLRGSSAAVITEIEIDMLTRLLRNPLYAAVQNFIGQVDSTEAQAKVKEMLERYLTRRGYPEAKVSLAVERSADGVTYTARVNEGDPCVIGRIELGFKLPPNSHLELSPGDICDREEIETAINGLEAELRERGYNQLKLELADVRYDHKNDLATVIVSGVLGQKVRYEIVDNSKLFLIDDLFADDELTKIDPTIVGPDAMSSELQRRYRNRGFIDVVIKGPEVKKSGEEEFVYVYFVDPGKQYILKSVQFEGVTIFKQDELLDFMGLTSLWQTARPLNYEELQTGLTALRARYQQAGYWDAKVRDPGTGQRDKETGTVRLTIQVEEGMPRHLGKVIVKGSGLIPEKEVMDMLGTAPGESLDRAKLVDFQQTVRTAYISRGFLYADVQIDLKAAEVKRALVVDVTVTINEGTRVKIGDITITGLARTHEKVVRRELLIQHGDWYDPERINLSRQALNRLGLFRSVQINPFDRNAVTAKEPEIDLVVDVREGKAGNVSFGPGWSLVKGWNYGAEASYSNIGGVGRQASVRGAISEERDQYAIGAKTLLGRKIGTGYIEPYIFDLPLDMQINANQKAEWGGALWELSYGGEVALIHKLHLLIPGSSVSTFYGQKVVKTEGSSTTVDDQVASDVRIGTTGVRFNIDERDNLKFPSSGYTLDTELAWARYGLGGDLRYFRWDVGSSRYFGLTDKIVLAFGFDITSYDGIERKGERLGVLPPSERLSSGGADTVRGYNPGSLGPIVRKPTFSQNIDTAGGVETPNCDVSYSTDALDGTSRTTIKTELRYRLNETMAVATFVDNGNVFLSNDQMKKFQQAYDNPVEPDVVANPACEKRHAQRSVEGNIGYDYKDLLKNPGYIWTRHYYSYGFSYSLLTALGSVNFAYGLPWREPETEHCADNKDYCYIRGNHTGPYWRRGEVHLNVGARF